MKLLLKILKIFLVFIAIIAVLGGAFWMVFIKKWPLWSGGSLILGSIGLVIGYHVIKKLLIRRRERQFVKQVVEQQKPLDNVTHDSAFENLTSLERQWADSLEILKESHLAKRGDPLYVLPWYMMLGKSGSGKSSAIRSARLSSPFHEAPRPAGAGTRFCDWWFTEHSIILDTAGRYSAPVMDGNDRDEWQRLLSLLLASRRKEPLNGLVVTVEADRLFENSSDELEEEGRAIRLRTDELMRVLGAKFPVYILITKCDQIFGIEQIAENLPDSFFRQPMGVVNDDFARPFTDFIEMTLDNLSERLKDLRVLLLDQAVGDKTRLMLLPEEIRKLRPGLENFMRGVFRANPYQESPLMRGIFFSSAQQTGTPVSRYIEQLEYPSTEENDNTYPGTGTDDHGTSSEQAAYPEILFMDVLLGTRRGLFLYDFFDWVLTADRWIFKPHRESVRRFRITWSLGLIAWLAFLGGMFGIISTSYILNRNTLNHFTAEFSEPVRLSHQILEDVIVLERLRLVILKMEESNSRWWIPRFGLSQSRDAVVQLKKNYCRLFYEFMETEIKTKISEKINKITPNTPGNERGAYITNIVGRLQYINAKLEKKDITYLRTLPRPSGAFLMLLDSRVTSDVSKRFQEIFLYYTAWQDDLTLSTIEKQTLTTWLGKVMVGPSGPYDFDWLLEWTNNSESASRITIANFWNGSGEVASAPVIEASFTVNGKKKIDDFLSRIVLVTAQSSIMENNMKSFKEEYEERYMSAWEQFSEQFSTGVNVFASIHEMRNQAGEIGTGKVPAELFIKRMVTELKPFSDRPNLPVWLKIAKEHETFSEQAHEEEFLKQASGFSKVADEVANKGKEMFVALKSQKVALPDKDLAKTRMDTLKAYMDYMKSLEDMAKNTNSGPAATRLATEIFSGASVAPSPQPADQGAAVASKSQLYHKAADAQKSYQAMMRRIGEDSIFWDTINSSLDFFVKLASLEASCSLQSQWESQVIAETGAANESSLQELLFGTQGVVWKFVKGPAAPFVKATPQGYQPVAVMGHRIAFSHAFLDFITRGNTGRQKIQESYPIRIKAYPVHVNREANPKPESVTLTLSCGEAPQSINNMNFPVQKTFKWSPKTCGDTVLRIKVGKLSLERIYPGARGMINFLSDFKDGDTNFTPEDFPEQENDLKKMNIRHIRIRYHFDGNRELFNLPEYAPMNVPPIIAKCVQRGDDDNR